MNVPGFVKFENKAPVDFVHSELTFQPGDATPWHYHPGPTLVTVNGGEITFTMGNCEAGYYRVGQSFVEGHPVWSAEPRTPVRQSQRCVSSSKSNASLARLNLQVR